MRHRVGPAHSKRVLYVSIETKAISTSTPWQNVRGLKSPVPLLFLDIMLLANSPMSDYHKPRLVFPLSKENYVLSYQSFLSTIFA
jgi:hypothetical protein